MTAPVDAARATSSVAATATPEFNLPTGISAGHLLLVAFRSGAAIGSNFPLPTGWAWARIPGSPDASDDYAGAMWKIADGSEGATVQMPDMGASVAWAAIAWRITDAGTPEASPLASQAGPSSAPNPPSYTAHGVARDYLVIAIGSAEDSAQTFSAAPTNYSNGFGAVVSSGAPGASIMGASRQLTGIQTEDPGAFTAGGSSNQMTNFTILIPAPPSGFPVDAGPVTTTVLADSTPTFNLPAGIQSGDVLVVAWRSGGDLASPNALPSGWSMLVTPASGDGSGDYAGAMWKRASGSEGASVTMADFGSAVNFAAIAWRITNGKDPSATAIASEAFSSTDAEVPLLDPPGGVSKFLWLVFTSAEGAGDARAAPAGYEKFVAAIVSTGAPGAGVGGASRPIEADSEDPPPFYMSSLRRMSFTAAIEISVVAPAASVTVR